MKIQYDYRVEEDINIIHDYYIKQESIEFAEQIVMEILDVIDSLEELPERGNYVNEMAPFGEYTFRELHHKVFRIIYSIIEDVVLVWMVIDGRRDLFPLIQKRGMV